MSKASHNIEGIRWYDKVWQMLQASHSHNIMWHNREVILYTIKIWWFYLYRLITFRDGCQDRRI